MIELSEYLVSPLCLSIVLHFNAYFLWQRGIEEEQIFLDLEAYGMLLVSISRFKLSQSSFKQALSTRVAAFSANSRFTAGAYRTRARRRR
jgi:hypothetical protein